MTSDVLDRLSFLLLLFTIILLPVFFLPFTNIPVEVSKSLLLVTGLLLSVILWTVARFYDGKIRLPKSILLLSGLGVVIATFFSAVLGDSPNVSMFGIMLDVGTFWFIFSGFLLLLFSSLFFSTPGKARIVLWGTLISSAIVVLFQTLHLFFPETLHFGMLGSKTANIVGSWSALGLFAGFCAILALFVLEVIPVSGKARWSLRMLILLDLFVIAAVNFLLIWELLGVFALIIFVYKISLSGEKEEKGGFPVSSFLIILLSLLFLMSSQFIGSLLPNYLRVTSNEVRPSFGSTMLVTKEVLKESPVLGVGPNRFGEVWAMHKPSAINRTLFVDTFFDSGSGLLPTLVSTTGALGILSWLLFFVAYLFTGLRLVFPKNGSRNPASVAPAFFLSSLFLFTASFFYLTGPVLFLLALSFAGICIGLYRSGEFTVSFADDPRRSFFSMLCLTLVVIASIAVGYKYFERFASVAYFRKALLADRLEVATPAIVRAYLLHQNDLYFRTYSQASLLALNSIVAKGQSVTDEDKTVLGNAFQEAVGSANLAVNYDKGNYLNYQMLGTVYSAGAALGVKGAYEEAVKAFIEASRLNPANPGLKLSIARAYQGLKKPKEVKDFANQALALKPDYVDALIVLSQIAKDEGNINGAISYAKEALNLLPGNKELIAYINSLEGPKK